MTGGGPAPRLVCVGKIVGVWGVNGWVRIFSYTRDRTDIFNYRQWIVGEGVAARTLELESGRTQGRGLVAKLRGVDDRDAAAAAVGALIQVTPETLPALEEGEYFWHQLEGLTVRTSDGTTLGTVDHLFETGANDILVVNGDRERLIPYTPEVVQDVNLEAGIIQVDWDPEF